MICYTKGPWITWDTGNGMSICPKDTSVSNEITRVRVTGSSLTNEEWDKKFEIVKANARLMAAAPEMLEALKRLADCSGEWNKDSLAAALDQAYDAIAKAEGK